MLTNLEKELQKRKTKKTQKTCQGRSSITYNTYKTLNLVSDPNNHIQHNFIQNN